MAKAVWNNRVIAESDETIIIEGNHYFPLAAVNQDLLRPNDHHSTCFWKGVASYYDVVVDGQANRNAAWYYPNPSDAAKQIKGYVAFWKGVQVTG
ncbi:MAG: DUF427 domain-containing protein [Anaerolineae bacterium]|nr:DUF427 domain-containing protein [Anaerolineae bacterium]